MRVTRGACRGARHAASGTPEDPRSGRSPTRRGRARTPRPGRRTSPSPQSIFRPVVHGRPSPLGGEEPRRGRTWSAPRRPEAISKTCQRPAEGDPAEPGDHPAQEHAEDHGDAARPSTGRPHGQVRSFTGDQSGEAGSRRTRRSEVEAQSVRTVSPAPPQEQSGLAER